MSTKMVVIYVADPATATIYPVNVAEHLINVLSVTLMRAGAELHGSEWKAALWMEEECNFRLARETNEIDELVATRAKAQDLIDIYKAHNGHGGPYGELAADVKGGQHV